MASQTIRDGRFPVAQNVSVFLRSQKIQGAAPLGAAVAGPVAVAADGSLTFVGLTDGVGYTAYASVSGVHTYADFTADPAPVGALGQPEGYADQRTRAWLPGSGVAENMARADCVADLAAFASGTLVCVGGGVLPKGRTISRIGFISGATAGATLTNRAFCLVRASDRVVLAKSVADASATWAANTAEEKLLAAPYTSQDDVAVYFGVVVAGTTPPSLRGAALGNAAVSSAGAAPVLVGTSNTGLAGTPASIPSPVAALAASANMPYAWAR